VRCDDSPTAFQARAIHRCGELLRATEANAGGITFRATRLHLLRHTRAMAQGTREAFLRYEATRSRVVRAMERAEWAIEDAKRFLARMSGHTQKRRERDPTPISKPDSRHAGS